MGEAEASSRRNKTHSQADADFRLHTYDGGQLLCFQEISSQKANRVVKAEARLRNLVSALVLNREGGRASFESYDYLFPTKPNLISRREEYAEESFFMVE